MLRRLPTSCLTLRTDLLDDIAQSLHILARRVVHASSYPVVRSYNHRLVMVLASCSNSLGFGVVLLGVVVVGHYDLCRGAGSLTHI